MTRIAALLLGLVLAGAAQADPQPQRWPAYQVIMWSPQTVEGFRALRGFGITGAKVQGIRGTITEEAVAATIAPPLAAGMRWYVENLATDLYSAYHRWTPERPRDPTWLFKEVQRMHRENPDDPAVYVREPSLSDPVWHERIRARLTETVRLHRAHRPFFYNLGDEAGIADLAAFWDFDFSEVSLAAFRVWLRGQYPDLAALNAQWGSGFAQWNEVMPEKTTPAMARSDENWSAWADFRAWMDIAFAQALRVGTDAVHVADPSAIVAIEGAQGPGWGGYDYTLLPEAVDLIEMYEGGHNMEIARAINPALITLSTSFGTGPAEVSRLWREALMGNRGTIIWDDAGDYAQGSARTLALAPVFTELAGPLGARLIATPLHRDPVAVLYSPASFRTRWMLDHRAGGAAWAARGSEIEGGADSAFRATLRRSMRALTRAGLQPHVLSPTSLAGGALERAGIRLLILPHSIALSAAEEAAIAGFAAAGGVVVADTVPGIYDSRSRRRSSPVLAGAALVRFPEAWQRDGDPGAVAAALGLAAQAGVVPLVRLEDASGGPVTDVEIRLFRSDSTLLVGLQQDFSPSGVAREMVLRPRTPGVLKALRSAVTPEGRLTLDPVSPAVIEIPVGR